MATHGHHVSMFVAAVYFDRVAVARQLEWGRFDFAVRADLVHDQVVRPAIGSLEIQAGARFWSHGITWKSEYLEFWAAFR